MSSQEKWLFKKFMLGFLSTIAPCLMLLVLGFLWWRLLNSNGIYWKELNATLKIGILTMVRSHNLIIFLFWVDSFIQNILSLKPLVQISYRFHHWIPRIEIFKTRSHVDRFRRTFFSRKNRMKKPTREHGFFRFPKEAHPCLSRKHNRPSRGSKTVPLAEKKIENTFFSFPRGTAMTLAKSTTMPPAKAKSWLSRKKRKLVFSFFLREARSCLSHKKKKKKTCSFSFLRGIFMPLIDMNPRLYEK